MSAMNCFVTSDAAHLFTDAARFDPLMRVAGFGGKVYPLMQYGAVVTAVGHAVLPLVLHSVLMEAAFDDFDHLAREFANEIHRYLQSARSEPGFADPGKFTAGLAGWSPRFDIPVFVSFRSYDDEGVRAFESRPASRYINPARAFVGDESLAGVTFDPGRPAESGLEIMRAQRNKRFRNLVSAENDHRLHHGIGGFCQHTIVARDAITMSVIERWPDQVGRPITIAMSTPVDGTFGSR